MPEGSNNVGIQAVDSGNEPFKVDFIALVENPDTGEGEGPPVNLVSDWTLY